MFNLEERMDGRGIMYDNLLVEPDRQVSVDDDLVLFIEDKRTGKLGTV
ncbi:hypothetical protein [Paenibacillus sp. NPDC057934]